MNKERIKMLIATKIAGQGNQVDVANALPEVLTELMELNPSNEIQELIDTKVKGIGDQLDIANVLPTILNHLVSMQPNEDITALINTKIAGQGTQIDLGGAVADVLDYIANISGYLRFKNVGTTNATIKIEKHRTPTAKTFQYKLGSASWHNYTEGEAITVAPNKIIQFRAADNLPFSESASNYRQFIMTGTIEANGSVDSVGVMGEYAYYNMFNGCTSLVTAPELPATTLANGCYGSMFYGCTGLATAPELPATTLADGCYNSMFNGCTSLVTAPELPATALADDCYGSMFYGCTSLAEVKCMASTLSIMYSKNWLQNVKATGTFYKNPAYTPSTRDASTIPSGWTVVDWVA